MTVIASGAAAASVLDISRPISAPAPSALLRSVCDQARIPPLRIARRYIKTAIGPGRLSFPDFIRLRLFDEAFHPGARLDAFVGQTMNRNLCLTVNFRHDWLGMLQNKVASSGYLAAHEMPVIPIKAVYSPSVRRTGRVLCDRAALEGFLTSPDVYPLFGKPAESLQSLGSIALAGSSPARRELIRTSGEVICLDRFMTEVETNYAAGYVFQPLARPHRAISAICGERLACLRILTAQGADGPFILRTVMKIPAGANSADNYWRSGNLLAQVEPASGRILRATSGAGLSTKHHAHHPDTGASLIDAIHPEWDAVRSLSLEGASLMRHVPLIGWDIALTDEGPRIVEMNENPDFFLVQFADRRGIMDESFKEVLAVQRRNKATFQTQMHKILRSMEH